MPSGEHEAPQSDIWFAPDVTVGGAWQVFYLGSNTNHTNISGRSRNLWRDPEFQRWRTHNFLWWELCTEHICRQTICEVCSQFIVTIYKVFGLRKLLACNVVDLSTCTKKGISIETVETCWICHWVSSSIFQHYKLKLNHHYTIGIHNSHYNSFNYQQ